MAAWICSYCRTFVTKTRKPSECENCGGPLRRPTREEVRLLDEEPEPEHEW